MTKFVTFHYKLLGRRIVAWTVIVCLGVAQTRTAADLPAPSDYLSFLQDQWISLVARGGEPTPIDASSPLLIPIKFFQQLGDLDYTSIMLITSFMVTLKSWSILKGALKDGVASRDKAIIKLNDLKVSQEIFSKKDELLKKELLAWETMEITAQESIAELEREFTKFSSMKKNKRGAWLKSEEGKKWAAHMFEKNKNLGLMLDAAYENVIQTSQVVFSEPQHRTVPKNFEKPNMSFQEIGNPERLTHHRERLDLMQSHVQSLRASCRTTVANFSTDIQKAKTAVQSGKHLGRWARVGAVGFGVGGPSTLFFYSVYGKTFGRNPVQLSADGVKKSQVKLKQESTLHGQITSDEGQAKLKDTLQIVNEVLDKNKAAIVASLQKRLSSADRELLKKQMLTEDDLAGFIIDPKYVKKAFESALGAAGNKRYDDGASLERVMAELYPSDKVVKDLSRPVLIHDFWIGFFDTLLAPIRDSGGATNRIDHDIYMKLKFDMIELLNQKQSQMKTVPTSSTTTPPIQPGFNQLPAIKTSLIDDKKLESASVIDVPKIPVAAGIESGGN